MAKDKRWMSMFLTFPPNRRAEVEEMLSRYLNGGIGEHYRYRGSPIDFPIKMEVVAKRETLDAIRAHLKLIGENVHRTAIVDTEFAEW